MNASSAGLPTELTALATNNAASGQANKLLLGKILPEGLSFENIGHKPL